MLNVPYIYLYDIHFIIFVLMSSLLSFSTCLKFYLSSSHFSIRFTTKLAPNIVIVSLCRLLNLSEGL